MFRALLTRAALLSALSLALPANAAPVTGFNQTTGGPYTYTATGNWVGGNINGIWNTDLTLTGDQQLNFLGDTVLSTGWTFAYAGEKYLWFRGSGGNRVVTLAGDISQDTFNNQTVYVGSATNGLGLTVDLGDASRQISVAANETLQFLSDITSTCGVFGITKTGAGTLHLKTIGRVSLTGPVNVNGGTLRTKDNQDDMFLNATRVNVNGATLAFSVDHTVTNSHFQDTDVHLTGGAILKNLSTTDNGSDFKIGGDLFVDGAAEIQMNRGGGARDWVNHAFNTLTFNQAGNSTLTIKSLNASVYETAKFTNGITVSEDGTISLLGANRGLLRTGALNISATKTLTITSDDATRARAQIDGSALASNAGTLALSNVWVQVATGSSFRYGTVRVSSIFGSADAGTGGGGPYAADLLQMFGDATSNATIILDGGTFRVWQGDENAVIDLRGDLKVTASGGTVFLGNRGEYYPSTGAHFTSLEFTGSGLLSTHGGRNSRGDTGTSVWIDHATTMTTSGTIRVDNATVGTRTEQGQFTATGLVGFPGTVLTTQATQESATGQGKGKFTLTGTVGMRLRGSADLLVATSFNITSGKITRATVSEDNAGGLWTFGNVANGTSTNPITATLDSTNGHAGAATLNTTLAVASGYQDAGYVTLQNIDTSKKHYIVLDLTSIGVGGISGVVHELNTNPLYENSVVNTDADTVKLTLSSTALIALLGSGTHDGYFAWDNKHSLGANVTGVTLLGDGPASASYTLAASPASLQVLKGGKLATTATITNNGGAGTDNLNFSGLGFNSGTPEVATSAGTTSGGPLAGSGANGSANTAGTTFVNGVDYGTATLTAAVVSATNANNPPGGNATPSGMPVTVTVTVGNATAAASGYNNVTSFSPANALSALVANGASYSGLSSKVTSGSTLSLGAFQTEAIIRMGKNARGSDQTIIMNWRGRATVEQYPGANPPLSSVGNSLISDVVKLSGPGTTNPTLVFALQMNYDPTAILGAGGEAGAAARGALFLVTLPDDGSGHWVLATVGNTYAGGEIVSTNQRMSWEDFRDARDVTDDNLASYLGSWGVDTTTHTVWAVLNHTGQFAVVPEPGTIILIGAGGACVSLCLLRRRRNERPA